MQGAFGDEAQVPFRASRKIFRHDLTVAEQRFALAETLAHLDEKRSEAAGSFDAKVRQHRC